MIPPVKNCGFYTKKRHILIVKRISVVAYRYTFRTPKCQILHLKR